MSENEIDWCGSREPLRPESRTRISRPNRIWQRKNNNNNNHIVERTMWMKDKKKNSRWLNRMCGWIQKLRSIYVALLHCRNCCRIIKCITKFYGMQKSDQRRRSSLREIHHTLARAHTRARKLFRRRPYVWQCNFERNVCYEMRSLIFFERTTEPEPNGSQKNRKSAVTHASHESRVGDGCARCFQVELDQIELAADVIFCFGLLKIRNNNNCLELRVFCVCARCSTRTRLHAIGMGASHIMHIKMRTKEHCVAGGTYVNRSVGLCLQR